MLRFSEEIDILKNFNYFSQYGIIKTIINDNNPKKSYQMYSKLTIIT